MLCAASMTGASATATTTAASASVLTDIVVASPGGARLAAVVGRFSVAEESITPWGDVKNARSIVSRHHAESRGSLRYHHQREPSRAARRHVAVRRRGRRRHLPG